MKEQKAILVERIVKYRKNKNRRGLFREKGRTEGKKEGERNRGRAKR